jgi:hypothetical protein
MATSTIIGGTYSQSIGKTSDPFQVQYFSLANLWLDVIFKPHT